MKIRIHVPIIGFALVGLIPLAIRSALAEPIPSKHESGPVTKIGARKAGASVTAIVAFDNSPYPFPANGMVPEDRPGEGSPFFQRDVDGRLFHLAPRAGKLFEAETYNDRRSLLAIPKAFDPTAPNAMIVLFLHGNMATLQDVEKRQGVPRQLAASGLNAVLVAPQLAVDALDSSPGRFYQPGFLPLYLHEAARRLAAISPRAIRPEQIDNLPVVIVAYSGGYLATAFALDDALARNDHRIAGVILLDALFGEATKFEEWIRRTRSRSFFVSAYSKASAAANRDLASVLKADGISVCESLFDHGRTDAIGPGLVAFVPVLSAVHNDFVTRAWTTDPLAKLLADISLSTPPSGSCERSDDR